MGTSEGDCLDALREAAERLGESPSKADYEALGLQPASATIIRVVGGWNEAKEQAGLETTPSTGSRVGPKPENADLPPDTDWADLSVDQRWHYRHVEHNTARTLERRRRLRSWVNDRKERDCNVSTPAVLDFHHPSPESKEMAIGEMVTHGYGKARLREEMERCVVLCSNCHRKEHADRPTSASLGPEQGSVRSWLSDYKRSHDCSRCGETDPRCLVFHHDSDNKRDTIANMVSGGKSKRDIAHELTKCTLLCANCHREEHYTPPEPSDETDTV